MLLFSEVSELHITSTDGSELSFTPGSDVTPYLALNHNGSPLQGVIITYTGSGAITLSVPEPSGTSLSLLVLASLAVRRRRKH